MDNGNKSQFIRNYNPFAPAAEVVAAGAEKGILFDASYVYTVRNAEKKRAHKAWAAQKRVTKQSETELRRLIETMGADRVRDILNKSDQP